MSKRLLIQNRMMQIDYFESGSKMIIGNGFALNDKNLQDYTVHSVTPTLVVLTSKYDLQTLVPKSVIDTLFEYVHKIPSESLLYRSFETTKYWRMYKDIVLESAIPEIHKKLKESRENAQIENLSRIASQQQTKEGTVLKKYFTLIEEGLKVHNSQSLKSKSKFKYMRNSIKSEHELNKKILPKIEAGKEKKIKPLTERSKIKSELPQIKESPKTIKFDFDLMFSFENRENLRFTISK